MEYVLYIGCISVFICLAVLIEKFLLRCFRRKAKEIVTFLTYFVFCSIAVCFFAATLIRVELHRAIWKNKEVVEEMIIDIFPEFEYGIDADEVMEQVEFIISFAESFDRFIASPDSMASEMNRVLFNDFFITSWILDMFRYPIYNAMIDMCYTYIPGFDDVIAEINEIGGNAREFARFLPNLTNEYNRITAESVLTFVGNIADKYIVKKTRPYQIAFIAFTLAYGVVIFVIVIIRKKRNSAEPDIADINENSSSITPPIHENTENSAVVMQKIPDYNTNYPAGYIPKDRTMAIVLCVLLGGFGGHRFYTGKVGSAILMIVVTLFSFIISIIFPPVFIGIVAWYVIDLVHICTGKFTDKKGYSLKKN